MTTGEGKSRLTPGERLRGAWLHRSYTVTFAALLPIPGVLAIIYGDQVSKALSNIAATVVSRGMGLALVLGSLLIWFGILRGRSLWEMMGLFVMAIGCTLYGVGVILGLGLGGVVAGTGFLSISIGAFRRISVLSQLARNVHYIENTVSARPE